MTVLADTTSLEDLLSALTLANPNLLPTSMMVCQEPGVLQAEGATATGSWVFWFRFGWATLRISRSCLDDGTPTDSDVTFSTDWFSRDHLPPLTEMIAQLWEVLAPPRV